MHIDLNNPLVGAAALWIFGAIVHGMPAPTDKSSTAYVWAYNTLQFCAANLANIGKTAK